MPSWREAGSALRMRARSTLGGCGLVALAIVGGCLGGGDPAGPSMGDGPYRGPFEDRPCPEDSILDYQNFGGPFLLTWCAGCHNAEPGRRQDAPESITFRDSDEVRAHLDRMWERAGDANDTMPPVGGPGLAERELLGEWLACGAP